jgi:hypothetical protein
MDARRPAKPLQTTDPNKAWRRWRPDMRDSRGVKLMKAAAKTSGNGRARVETGRRMNAGGA